jgi:hypothetical protein
MVSDQGGLQAAKSLLHSECSSDGLTALWELARLDITMEAVVIQQPWSQHCGWGIRWIGRGWLWNVSGLRAVELELRDGRRFRVGSNRPERLAEALRQG